LGKGGKWIQEEKKKVDRNGRGAFYQKIAAEKKTGDWWGEAEEGKG